jgi:hypothetical protein
LLIEYTFLAGRLTSTDVRIFFALEEGTITVLDVARKATIVSSGRTSRANSHDRFQEA